MKVYVHLAHGFDAQDWERRWRSGQLIGFNEASPYGYAHAGAPDVELRFSRDRREGRLARVVRGGLRLLLGFDVVHAWRNRAALRAADVVWTHTESQHLAAAALIKLMPAGRRPRLLAQSVWLIDRWDGLGAARRVLYRWLMREAGVLTFLSPLNRDRAARLFPDAWCAMVPFGVCTDARQVPAAASHATRGGMRVLALGNDRHRDWDTMLAAFGDQPDVEVTIASGALQSRRIAKYRNVVIRKPQRNAELMALYAAADVVVLPLKPNLHASGITVLQEAVLAGRPVVCTRSGGLDSYFADGEVAFVPPGDPAALREAAARLYADPAAACAMAQAAQRRMTADDLGSRAFARAHVALSRALLAAGPKRRGWSPPVSGAASADANC